MSKNKQKTSVFGTLWGWLRRMFLGAGNQYANEVLEEKAKNPTDAEEIVSPMQQYVRNFKERKLAVCALVVLIAMFLVVFIGPLFMPNYSDSYTETLQQNVRPNMSMMSVPSSIKNDLRMIDGNSSFSVGVSNSGKLEVWGDTVLGTTGIDVKDIPEEVQNAHIVMAAAGFDHIIAIDENGKIYGWGSKSAAQYGVDPIPEERRAEESDNTLMYMPDELWNGTFDVANIRKLVCGYQASAILMNDGTLHIWGNRKTYANIDKFVGKTDLVDIDFTLNYVVGITEAGNMVFTGTRGLYDQVRTNLNESATKMSSFLGDRKIVALDAGSKNICLRLSDNSICFVGDFDMNSKNAPVLPNGEYFTDVSAGARHYTGITNLGNVYSWGSDTFGQATASKKATGASQIFTGAFQSYAVNDQNELQAKWGLSGYLFGTDNNGADIFQRIINGGKMTMTIGAVAVIISSIIGILIGCISGYFGGMVDILLMRLAEIVNAIPFLPFAMILSSIMSQMTLTENTRIFIIMCILGVLTWPGLARLVRGQVLVARENEYVVAAQSMGVTESKIAFKHILPNVMSVIIVNLTLNFASCMLTESSLSYLGFGVNYPRPTWGNMLNRANNATVIANFWWQWVFTSLFLSVTTICINIIGDALRDVMDPKSSLEK